MGSIILLPMLLGLIGVIGAIPGLEEFRSNLEFFDTNLAEPNYRLLDNVQPTYLNIDLDVYLAESRFNGLVQIEVNFLCRYEVGAFQKPSVSWSSTDMKSEGTDFISVLGKETDGYNDYYMLFEVLEANLSQIVLHQKVVAISAVTVLNSVSQHVPLQFPDPFETDDYFELLKINFASPIAIGTYTITISYLGQINENPLDEGFYKGYYYINNQKREYATTQFQPFHARKAFPCFDEPQFKSRFVMSITRDSNLSPSYSNMAINETQLVATGRIREAFLPTPIISAYLMAFHVSDFVETTATGTEPFGIISRQGVTDQHSYAAEIGLKITNELGDYFAINYYDMGQGQPMKNDHIALPDFPSGAMENWGMVNYRETFLLYDPANTSIVNKHFIASIMAHELAHKWFGNLVTCFWWSNLWLNESFASFFGYFGAHYVDESLELADQFVVDYVHSALNWDSGTTATPMNWTDVVDNPSVSAHFSTTSYEKGAAVLRMMEHFVGARNFRNALRYYLRDNAYGIGTPEDMYAAFRTAVAEDSTFAQLYPNIDVGAVFDRWVQTPGSPVLDVDVNMSNGEITITQERFMINGNTNNDLWLVPVSWTHSGAINFQNTRPSFVLTQKTTVVTKDPGHHWVILNVAQSGLYRVNYDDHNWEMIAAALRNDRNMIHKLNRAQIVNDVLHFVRASKITIARAFDVLSFLSSETDYYVWAGALTELDWIRRRMEHLPSAHEEFSAYLSELMGAAITELGYEDRASDSTSVILARMMIMNYACNTFHHEGCVNYATQRWAQYRQNDNNLVPVNARRYVYCTGVRNGDSSDYNFLFQKYNTSENTAEMEVILRTLACTKDVASLEHYLYQSMYNDRIRIHDRTNAFNYALRGNPENLATILSFLERHFADIRETYGGDSQLDTCISALATYLTDFEDITTFQTWLYATQTALGTSFSTGVSVINTSINNLVWGNTNAPDIFAFLRSRNSASGFTAPFVLLLVAMAAHLFNK